MGLKPARVGGAVVAYSQFLENWQSLAISPALRTCSTIPSKVSGGTLCTCLWRKAVIRKSSALSEWGWNFLIQRTVSCGPNVKSCCFGISTWCGA